MREGWQITKLGEVCNIIGGGTPSKANKKFYVGNIPWATVRDMKSEILTETEFKINELAIKNSSTNVIPKGNVIIATRVGLGKVCLLKYDTAINQDLKGIIPKDGKNLRVDFLFRWFKIISDEIIKHGTGATVQGVKISFIENLEIPIPPLSEQKRIVEILDEAFSAIDKAKANVEKNLQNAKELFESYLENVFANKNAEWEEKPMIEICTLINGRAYKQQELLNKGKYPVLRVGNFFTNKDWYYSDFELSEDKYCDNGDLLYAWSASFGPRIWEGEKVIYHYHIWKVIPNTDLVTKEFLFLLLEWDKEQIKKAHGTGTTMMHVGKGSMEQRVLPIPNLKEQVSIVQKVNAILGETKKLEMIYQQKLNDLEELKKSILQKAFTGELTAATKTLIA